MLKNIVLSKNKKYLSQKNGKPFFWLADTWWYGMTIRMNFEIFKKLAVSRKNQGFSVIQIVVGIPPETNAFSNNATNSGGHPFTKSWQVNPSYFLEVDKKIKFLTDIDLIPCIVGNWGDHIDKSGVENMKNFWTEIVKRYAAYPVIFCLTGEVDKFSKIWHLPKVANILNKFQLRKRLSNWEKVARHIKTIDENNHLLTVHVQSQKSAQVLFNNPAWLDINTIQSGHSKDRIAFMVETILHESKKEKPIINLEPWYEGILNKFGDLDERNAFWLCILSGAKGHSYGAHGIWQMSTKNDDFLNHWGHSNWEIAKRYQGAKQLGEAKKFLEKYQWWKLTPCFEIVNPHWTKSTTNEPVAAKIEGKYIFIYFPQVNIKKEYFVNLKTPIKGTIFQINPRRMQVISKAKFSKKNIKMKFSDKYQNRDLLIIIKLSEKA